MAWINAIYWGTVIAEKIFGPKTGPVKLDLVKQITKEVAKKTTTAGKDNGMPSETDIEQEIENSLRSKPPENHGMVVLDIEQFMKILKMTGIL